MEPLTIVVSFDVGEQVVPKRNALRGHGFVKIPSAYPEAGPHLFSEGITQITHHISRKPATIFRK
jgi:hypothetical protein